MDLGRYENDALESLLYLHDIKDSKHEKNDTVIGIYLKAVVPARKRNFFCHNIIEFVDTLKLNNERYKFIGTIREGNSEEKLVFTMKYFF